MKKIILFLFALQFTAAWTQERLLKTTVISALPIDADIFVGIDATDNTYYIKNNVLFKAFKETVWQYKNISLGRLSKVDIQNPLKTMLFYENFNTIILLDNQLSEIQKITLSENTVPIMATAAGIAFGNRLWIYNGLTQDIGLFDFFKNNYQAITPPISGIIKHYESNFNTFQWIDTELNRYSCDVFGKISNLGKVADFDQLQTISKKEILYTKGDAFYIQDLEKNSLYRLENMEKSFKNFYYKDQILSIFTKQEISNYKIIRP